MDEDLSDSSLKKIGETDGEGPQPPTLQVRVRFTL
jgi:hypothetical protein